MDVPAGETISKYFGEFSFGDKSESTILFL